MKCATYGCEHESSGIGCFCPGCAEWIVTGRRWERRQEIARLRRQTRIVSTWAIIISLVAIIITVVTIVTGRGH